MALNTIPSVQSCGFNTCAGCALTDVSFMQLLADENKVVQFLVNHGVLSCHILCPNCSNRISVSWAKYMFRCQKSVRCSKRKSTKCATKLSAFRGTFFERSQLSLTEICILVNIFLSDNRAKISYAVSELQCSQTTVVDWFSFCREVVADYVVQQSQPLGGPGKVVEIDEAKLGKRKYNRGRLLTGQWVIGGIERGQDQTKVFLQSVPDRTSETLIGVIKRFVLPGTTIMTDCWKGYDQLRNEDFQHFTVNHSLNFVDPTTGAHTQNIERLWVEVRKRVPKGGFRAEYLDEYLFDTLFRKMERDYKRRRHIFWQAVATLYPPQEHTLA